MTPLQNHNETLNQRISPRISPQGLFATERTQTHIFVSPVENISLGGICLKGRVLSPQSTSTPTQITLQTQNGPLDLNAIAVYDRRQGDSYGVGYSFIHTKNTEEKLNALLGNLNQNSAS